jgi:hypothetical protein
MLNGHNLIFVKLSPSLLLHNYQKNVMFIIISLLKKVEEEEEEEEEAKET